MNAFDHTDRMIAYAADHRDQLLAEAETERLLQEIRKGQPATRFSHRLLQGMGNALIHVGHRLKMAGHSSNNPLR